MEQKFKNLSQIIEDFFQLRLKKSLNLILNGIPLKNDALCLEELEIFSSIDEILRNYLENLKSLVHGEFPHSLTNETLTGEYILIRFLKEIPQIIGTDLKQYGPFLIDDIAILPKENVETLLKHQAVTLIKKR